MLNPGHSFSLLMSYFVLCRQGDVKPRPLFQLIDVILCPRLRVGHLAILVTVMTEFFTKCFVQMHPGCAYFSVSHPAWRIAEMSHLVDVFRYLMTSQPECFS